MDEPIDFHGAKVALFVDEELLVYRRDDNPDIPFPDMWDLPGGGRENGESGAECVVRETYEEFGIRIDPDDLIHLGPYENWRGKDQRHALFFVGHLPREQLSTIVFGHEGQHWRMMAATAFLQSKQAVPHLQKRLREYLAQ